eukprot:gene2135-2331_t
MAAASTGGSITLPKPAFTDCDETSLKLHWDPLSSALAQYKITLQYKQVFLPWEQAKERDIIDASHILLKEADVVDLEPGTPYSVRLVAVNEQNGSKVIGPESVFDTKPVDCGPKRKKCTIC